MNRQQAVRRQADDSAKENNYNGASYQEEMALPIYDYQD